MNSNKGSSESISQLNPSVKNRIEQILGDVAKTAGILIPLFSLRTQRSLGVGEIPDLKLLIQWCDQIGFKFIQLLPLNDTGPDPSPYSARSSMALNPIYLSLAEVGGADQIREKIDFYRQHFNKENRLQYLDLRGTKLNLLEMIFQNQMDQISTSPAFIKFKEHNPWLVPYAVFCVLKDHHDQKWWREWPTHHQHVTDTLIQEITTQLPERCLFHQFVQWELEKQLLSVRESAQAAGVALKGDIPILMNDDSVDVWCNPSYFSEELRAGAPPDMFSDKGQNWGFPIYLWEVLQRDNYQWWRNRLQQMGKFYHAIRIDHLLGFFRIWAVPKTEQSARLGYFVPSAPLTDRSLAQLKINKGIKTQLSVPHFSKKDLTNYFGSSVQEILEIGFTKFSRRGFYRFGPHIRGEKDIEQIFPVDPKQLETLYSLWADRALLATNRSDCQFAFRWAYPQTRAYQSLPKARKRSIDAFIKSYERKQNKLWKENGTKLLTMIKESSDLLICAEDLGYVPPVVQPVLQKLGILSLKVQRWVKNYGRNQVSFIDPREYPLLSVCAPSIHDTTTLRGWWEEDRSETQQFYNFLGFTQEAPAFLTPNIAETILRTNLNAGSLITILALQDIFSLTYELRSYVPDDERINRPGIISDRNWSWRMGVTVEELLRHSELNTKLRLLLQETERFCG